jgi:hypothetical protein
MPHDCEEHRVTNVVGDESVSFCARCDRTLCIEADPDAGTWPAESCGDCDIQPGAGP